MTSCPRCNPGRVEVRGKGNASCAQCGGAFISLPNAFGALKKAGVDGGKLQEILGKQGRKIRPCVTCTQLFTSFPIGGETLHACVPCGAFWVDAGTLDRLTGASQAPPPPPPPEPAAGPRGTLQFAAADIPPPAPPPVAPPVAPRAPMQFAAADVPSPAPPRSTMQFAASAFDGLAPPATPALAPPPAPPPLSAMGPRATMQFGAASLAPPAPPRCSGDAQGAVGGDGASAWNGDGPDPAAVGGAGSLGLGLEPHPTAVVGGAGSLGLSVEPDPAAVGGGPAGSVTPGSVDPGSVDPGGPRRVVDVARHACVRAPAAAREK